MPDLQGPKVFFKQVSVTSQVVERVEKNAGYKIDEPGRAVMAPFKSYDGI